MVRLKRTLRGDPKEWLQKITVAGLGQLFKPLGSSAPQVVTAIVESGKNMSAEQKKTERCPLLYEWHKKQYIGAAHGMAGIYCMLMQVRVRWLVTCAM